ncbi:c-type cytochrome [Jannaschia seohaensis]|uniref:Cytochrome c553 n=1 Tax=Jannaschia seohaensis TaxID=475081 RepID=A0A2Y9B6X5_9RHOB|nr:c-type cytochrome [Jannaschia seohaensis]PWJ15080.1 cytochrome c553 [Jannaschia seohaensis]SSA49929.1 Cytochrome c553 [Jannaschia seohaensis]
MIRPLTLILGGLTLAGGIPAQAGDPAAGRQVANMCRTCHGLDGYAAIPIAPHIGGEPAEYLAAQLMAFKTGAREHEMMSIVAGGLSESQIADVSAWYAAHDVVATLPEGVSEDDAPELCAGCHGVNGLAVVPDAPNLAGEVNVYTDTQLKAFRSGRREHEVMSGIAADLTDEEIREVANWYAEIVLEITPPE